MGLFRRKRETHEEQLLRDGKHHEWLTVEVLRSEEMRQVLKGMMPSPDPDQVAKIAIGPEKWGKWFGKPSNLSFPAPRQRMPKG